MTTRKVVTAEHFVGFGPLHTSAHRGHHYELRLSCGHQTSSRFYVGEDTPRPAPKRARCPQCSAKIVHHKECLK